MSFDIYTMITDRIIAELSNGVIPWHKPWAGGSDVALSHNTGKPYSLVNQLLLGKPGEYLTYKQAEAAGGHVKKGARGSFVVFWKPVQSDEIDPKTGKPHTFPVLKYYNVFHLDDCEGISPKWTQQVCNDNNPIESAQAVFNSYIQREGILLEQTDSTRAYYSPVSDMIHLPRFEQFDSAAAFYDVAFHEATHSTGHTSRLNRLGGISPAPFGSEDYSKEELVAEIGSAAIMHRLGIETDETFRNNAAYIQSWLQALNDDKRMIVSAASKAEKAMAYIMGDGISQEEE